MVNGLIEVGADQAAAAYIEELPLLARAQNTGMKRGEVSRTSRAVDNPLGEAGALKSSDVFELTEADARPESGCSSTPPLTTWRR